MDERLIGKMQIEAFQDIGAQFAEGPGIDIHAPQPGKVRRAGPESPSRRPGDHGPQQCAPTAAGIQHSGAVHPEFGDAVGFHRPLGPVGGCINNAPGRRYVHSLDPIDHYSP